MCMQWKEHYRGILDIPGLCRGVPNEVMQGITGFMETIAKVEHRMEKLTAEIAWKTGLPKRFLGFMYFGVLKKSQDYSLRFLEQVWHTASQMDLSRILVAS